MRQDHGPAHCPGEPVQDSKPRADPSNRSEVVALASIGHSGRRRQKRRKRFSNLACVLFITVLISVLGVLGLAELISNGILRTLTTAKGLGALIVGADVFATIIFAVAGACVTSNWVARKGRSHAEQLLLGVLWGTVTGIGGGTVRDIVILQVAPVWLAAIWMPMLVPVFALMGALLGQIRSAGVSLSITFLDFVALGCTTVIGVEKATTIINSIGGMPEPLAIAPLAACLAFFTACGGGIVRDIFLGRAPFALVTSYSSLAVFGGVLHANLAFYLTPTLWPITVAIIFVVGVLSRNWRAGRLL